MKLVAMTQLVLMWFLLHYPAAAVALDSSPASAESAQQLGCPSKCGDVDILYPFSIDNQCVWPGNDDFTVSCNDSFTPPRPYYGNIEIIDISLEKGEMHVYTPVVYECYNSKNTTEPNTGFYLQLNITATPFLVAQKSNEFTGIGCDTLAMLQGRDDWSFFTGCISTCVSLDEAAKDGEPCTGLGCCQVPSIPANLSTIEMTWGNTSQNNAWRYSPCNYAFVAEKDWYKFNRQDLSRNGSKLFVNRNGHRHVPMVLDWAIRKNGSCLAKKAPACVSNHSECFNVTNGEGYLCKCTAGYHGNPYVTGNGGCTNINECEQSPCSGGTCHDLEGSFECKCNFGQKTESENDKIVCRAVLSNPAKAVIAITCAVAILSILLILLIMIYEKKRLREIFNKNGGQLLKNIGIKLFTKEEIRKITNNYGKIIGKGGFGEVYQGDIDNNQQVAVKRSITVDKKRPVAVKRIKRSITVDEKRRKDFANEITIQSQISHKNVVKLVGCCLETNIPMLVFEYIPKGSLHDVLHGNGDSSNNIAKDNNLTLEERLAIAIGSAEALHYMHSSPSQKILHGDVKSSNILLDESNVPKVSDFGISRFMTEKDHTNLVIGDKGYIDPVYVTTGILTEKSDVYSFGVVLLELITRKKARYGNNSLRIDFIDSYKSDSRAREMFDDEFVSAEDIDCLAMIGRIAVQSLEGEVKHRPTMKQVLEQLHSTKQ
ncbi:hypothetical protein ABZP36_009990 [Zizania latifolia]